MSLRTFVSTNNDQMYEFASIISLILEHIVGVEFGLNGIIFVQDAGMKKKDVLYIDKSTSKIVKALMDTDVTECLEDKFQVFQLPVISEGGEGKPGPQGPAGKPFTISKVYQSIEQMNSQFSSDKLPEGSFVIINTNNVEDEDNAKLYLKGKEKYEFITDMSGPAGKNGLSGKNGMPGVNGLSIKLEKSGGNLTTSFTGERMLQSYFGDVDSVPITVNTYNFTKMKSILLNSIPNSAKNVRLQYMSFLGEDKNGKNAGSTSPAYRPGQVPPNTFPHLGSLDPSNGTKYPVEGGQCNIVPSFDTQQACVKELENINKYIQEPDKKAVRIESIMYEFEYLDESDKVIGKTKIRERFSKDVTDAKTELMPISELKGDAGKDGAKGIDGKSAYQIAKEHGATTADSEEKFAKEFFKVKNIKDNTLMEIWTGTSEEFAAISEQMKPNVIYYVTTPETGEVTVKVKKSQ